MWVLLWLAKPNVRFATLSSQLINECQTNDAALARISSMLGVCINGFKLVIRVLVRCAGIRLHTGVMGRGEGLRNDLAVVCIG
jgi:hypothetical protein